MASCRKGTPASELRKKVYPTVIVRQRITWRRKEGTFIYFEDNAGVIVNNKREMDLQSPDLLQKDVPICGIVLLLTRVQSCNNLEEYYVEYFLGESIDGTISYLQSMCRLLSYESRAWIKVCLWSLKVRGIFNTYHHDDASYVESFLRSYRLLHDYLSLADVLVNLKLFWLSDAKVTSYDFEKTEFVDRIEWTAETIVTDEILPRPVSLMIQSFKLIYNHI